MPTMDIKTRIRNSAKEPSTKFSFPKKPVFNFLPKDFVSDAYQRAVLAAGSLVNIILWVIILIKVQDGSKPIPLHFNAVYGIEFVGKGYLLFELPLIGLLVFATNFLLARHLTTADVFMSRFINTVSLVLQIFLLIAVFGVLYLNR